jgi:acetylornithine deacetylase
LIDFVRDYLDRWRVKSELVFDAEQRKANLFATIGPNDIGGVMLSGHSDVVPVDGQDWASDPFKLEPRDGMLYARGAADMKSFIAVMLAKVPEFVSRSLAVPIHLALTYDEEVGCLGVRTLVTALASRAVKPRLCIIGEPTLMKPVIAHKGSRRLRCHVHGHEAHSALPHLGVNAIEAAAAVITHINGIARNRRANGPFDPAFSPTYTTLQTSVIAGGTASNIVPNECRFDFDIRHLPHDDPDLIVDDVKRFAASLLPEMQGVSAQAGIAFEETNTVAALSITPDEEVVQLALALSGANGTGKVSFGTEGGFFQQGGIPTVICGPGSIEQAHKADEFIALAQVKQCEDFIDRLIERVRH